MDQNEVMLRAIGILTESKKMFDVLNRDANADYETSGAISSLLNDVFPDVDLPAGTTAQQAGETVGQAALAASLQLVSAFTFLFSELAEIHDSGRNDIKTAELLRELALRFSEPSTED